MTPNIFRGDLYFADLNSNIGCEQGGARPVLVIQNNIGNLHSNTTIIAAITARKKHGLPTHVLLPKMTGLREESVILLEQLRTIDKMRLGPKIGVLNSKQLRLVDIALMTCLGLRGSSNNLMVMTLCRTCAQAFRDSNEYILNRTNFEQETHELCTICNTRMGCDFEITRL